MFQKSLQTILAASILALSVTSVGQQNAQAQQPAEQNSGVATFTLTNGTSRPLEAFYAPPPQVDNWEEDILEGKPLMPGESVKVTIDDGRPDCKYDFKGTLGPAPDGSVGRGELIQSAVEVCDGGSYEYTE